MQSKVGAMMMILLALAMVAECSKFNEGSWGTCHSGGNGSTSSCSEVHRELEDVSMDYEMNVRELATRRKAISYEALKQNALPCNQGGRSYYACGGGGPVNPYTRGCLMATGCRRSVD
ncbi:Protein RALF-like 19 [Hibiscus syriacus]|uniref:Protein RALF-like 19 n=1 Tax=Hibiscus syriacus TaxID=106335 RepID=A0A6A3C686_HIBSY|nr:Protein RALF-like 19 [Hibiscus syriacus]